MDIQLCTIDDELKAVLKKFRFRKEKNNAAVIMKIDMKSRQVVVEDELEDVTIEDVAEELPEFSPRYIAYSYCHHHADGRFSVPLMFIYYCPGGVKPDQNMLYASTKTAVVNEINITKVFEVRSAEEMTEEWMKRRLNFFD
ncbi:GMFB protein [Salpingoeca rosetta]|uniref:GMFB protein n=1 Tax=Salpingoeca rosetta (strain ATCC 50818 / BSB-021) TaxID=946362 RepID=F2UEE8_SALR5|nr:GMFB protein [Salpingoeca rosetta]EGD74998.1 GMFB protein [Salpingoeca rosetta]|eukprot:XP_004992642.1 GMFB protein [Salpingoeca rosetta]